MKTWAKREVELMCNNESDCFDYVGECAKSALKAYEVLCEDGHSGMSIQLTKAILNKLIDHVALTPIEDIPEIWNDVTYDDYKTYQCSRMSSLFKDVYADGKVKYHDTNRTVAYDIDNPNLDWHNGRVSKIIDDMFPITMPYTYEGKYEVCCESFLTDVKNGDFDTEAYLYVVTPGGDKIDINIFMHEINGEMVKITKEEYEELKKRKL